MANDTNSLMKWAGVTSPWDLVKSAIDVGATRIFLWGPPGTGKSHVGLFGLAGGKPVQVWQVSLSEDLSVQELIGHPMPPKGSNITDKMLEDLKSMPAEALAVVMPILRESGWSWHDGPITRAMRGGEPLVINELGRASDSVKDALLGVLDDPKVARLSLPSGETIKPLRGFRVVATSNSSIHDLDPALQDRFEAIIHVNTPNPALLASLNSAMGGLGDAILDSYKDPGKELSPRRALAYLSFRARGVNAKQAASLAFQERGPDFLVALKSRGCDVDAAVTGKASA